MSDDDVFTFTVTNETELAITELWASIDEEEWLPFGLPDGGIPPGEAAVMTWAEHTNDSPCEWYVSVVFEDESETESEIFNFCEEPNLVVS